MTSTVSTLADPAAELLAPRLAGSANSSDGDVATVARW